MMMNDWSDKISRDLKNQAVTSAFKGTNPFADDSSQEGIPPELFPRYYRDLKQLGKVTSGKGRVAFVSGKFNVLHPGHLRLLQFAKEISDFLVVGVLDDQSGEDFYLPESERLLAVLAVTYLERCGATFEPGGSKTKGGSREAQNDV